VFFNVLTGRTENVNPNDLAAALGGARFGDRGDFSATALRRGALPPSKGVISDPPAEAIVVLLDISSSMALDAYPEAEAEAPPEGIKRLRFTSFVAGWTMDVVETITVDELKRLLFEQQRIAIDTPMMYRGATLESGHSLVEYGIESVPIFVATETVCAHRLCTWVSDFRVDMTCATM